MSSFGIFDIAGQGMSAQNIRLNAVASNMANAETVGSTPEDAYHAKYPIFASVSIQTDPFQSEASVGKGVKVSSIVDSTKPLNMKYDPSHPKANKDGFIYQSNVNVVQEMADMISASRSYQTNAQMLNTAKELIQNTLNLGR